MNREVIVSLDALNRVVKYLVDRPYKEVADLISNLKTTIREIPENEPKKEEK